MAHDINDCKSVFVTWTWAIGIVVAISMGVGALTWTYATRENTQDNRIWKCETTSDKIYSDMDTIKSLLRENK